ncbi:glycosyltransferase family 2 protein [Paludibacterium denitrificans]|uniref:Glycosyltransferase n=1 Tax=Paludibacterium denitrificans TaxID=2675226 RepID=A0A844GDQ0_9NEIS|nr:glycosyltransferase family 2 protein [Paludibacterium denitrificans]MTD32874.1 glycosyltransferase [Paludibacterium denitrificans]
MSSPLVSILIPAYRSSWLDVALESALAQTHKNIEIIVGDDAPNDAVQQVLAHVSDPGIRYIRNPRRGQPWLESRHADSAGRGDYIKFLFDDDYLLPRSVEILLYACLEFDARLAFHNRHAVDSNGNLLASPTCIVGGGYAEIAPDVYFSQIIKNAHNPIGEPSNILIHTTTLRAMPFPFAIGGRRMRFLTDVALYTNFAASGHSLVGAAEFGSAFRQHSQQTSGRGYPGFSAGLYEWELLRRWAAENQLLSSGDYFFGEHQQMQLYQRFVGQYPELQGFIDLQGLPLQGHFMSNRFREALNLADCTIAIRMLAKS